MTSPAFSEIFIPLFWSLFSNYCQNIENTKVFKFILAHIQRLFCTMIYEVALGFSPSNRIKCINRILHTRVGKRIKLIEIDDL